MTKTFIPVEIPYNTPIITLKWAHGETDTINPTSLLNIIIGNHQLGNTETINTLINAIIAGQEK
jgi:hypothetical protein